MTIRTRDELEGMSRAGRVVRTALREMKKEVRAGVTTQELDDVCTDVFERFRARSAPRLVYGFPGAACISINDEAVHGIPRATRTVREGDLVKLDVTAELDGYIADAATTVPVGKVSPANLRLLRCARTALRLGINAAGAGRPINQIGKAIQNEVERQGFSVMPALGGHGVGRTIHETPSVHNYYSPWDDGILNPGLVIAIEPVISAGSGRNTEPADGWTVKTAEGAMSAHFEHTVVVTRERAMVLTT